MSKKNNNDGFNNRACRKFRDNSGNKIELMSQEEIFDILSEDTEEILRQLTNARKHINGAKYPTYTSNMFANLSTPLYFWYYVRTNVKVKKGKLVTTLTKDEIESLKQLISDAYKKSSMSAYSQAQEYADRNKLLLKTFEYLDPKRKKIAKKLKLKKHQIRTLLIQTYGDPRYNMKYVHKLMNASPVSEKKKLKIFKKLYGKRFVAAIGAAMTINNADSDFLATAFRYVKSLKLKKRAPFIRAYADAYKLNGTTYHQFTDKFAKKNKKLIRELKFLDIGYKKAFKHLHQESNAKKTNKKKNESPRDRVPRNDKFKVDPRDLPKRSKTVSQLPHQRSGEKPAGKVVGPNTDKEPKADTTT